jgi:hypothetical protein
VGASKLLIMQGGPASFSLFEIHVILLKKCE